MLFRLASDLHFEWRLSPLPERLPKTVNRHLLAKLPPGPRDKESILVLAGDISSYKHQRLEILRQLSRRFNRILYVPGNHEFYGGDISNWVEEVQTGLSQFSNVSCAPADGVGVVDLGEGVRALLTPLWSNYGLGSPLKMTQLSRTSDTRSICFKGDPITPEGFGLLHKECAEELKHHLEAAQEKGLQTVVATHYVPSFTLRDVRYDAGVQDEIFMSSQEELMLANYAPALWMFGHTHQAHRTRIGNTELRCNPCGYPREIPGGYNDLLTFEMPPPRSLPTPFDSITAKAKT